MPSKRAPGVVLAVVAFGVFIAADDLTVVSTMLRQIIGDLGIALPDGFDRAAWIVNSYLVAYVAVMPFMGRLSDVLGRRRVFVAALTVFLAGSIWIPLTNSLGPFIIGRVLTAIGGGAMVPVAIAAIGDAYPERGRARPLGVLGAIDTIGWVWGPLFGALLVRFLDWRWQFWLNIPLSILAIGLAWWAMADFDRPQREARVDWPGAATLSVALVAVTIGLLNTSEISAVDELADLTGAQRLPSIPFFLIAAVAIGAFLLAERRAADPLIDLGLFRRPDFAPAVVVNFIIGAVLIIAMVDVPLFVNLVVETDLERAAVLSGWVLSALTATMAIAAYAGGRMTGKLGRRPVVALGIVLSAAAFGLMGAFWSETVSPWLMALHLVLLGAGFGVVIAPIHDAAVEAAPPDRRGTAGALVILARLIGLAVGLSGLTAWAIYRFDTLRSSIDLPPLGTVGYEQAAAAAQAELSATALGETFLFSAGLIAVALVAALLLQRRTRPGPSDEASR